MQQQERIWAGLPVPRRYWALAAVWLALAMGVLDGAIANIALSAIARDLHTGPAEAIWVINAYQLAIVVSLLPMAALGEAFGYRRVFQVGVFVFVAASLGCAMAHSLPALALARALQGLGAAAIFSINAALLRYSVPAPQMGRFIGYNALIVGLFASIGPTVASAILAVAPWQLLFAINLPIGIASLAVGWFSLPDSHVSGRKPDLISALLNVAAFGLTITGIDVMIRVGAYVLGGAELALGVLSAVLLVRRSLSEARPLVPIDLLRNRVFSLSVLTSIASFSAQMLAFVALPFYFEGAMHYSQVTTGLLMTPWPAAVTLAAPMAGWLADRYPSAILGAAGMALLTLGLLLLCLMPADAGAFAIAWRMVLSGLGFGCFQSPNNRTLLSSAPLERSGAAAGMLATARLTGQTIGATLATIMFGVAATGETLSLAVAAGFAALAALLSLSRLGDQRR
jgi:MFS transporter, DHA2 family, multidrug resistance protein